MSRRGVGWSVFLRATVTTAALCGIVFAQQRDTPRRPDAPAAAPGTLTGRVISANDGRPLRGAKVEVVTTGNLARSAITDADGRFTLADLMAGSYTARAAKTGFVTQQSGQRHPLERARSFQIAAGARYSLDFALMRGSVISGNLLDVYGDPVAGALVEVRRSRIVRGRRQLSTVVRSDTTDDTGAFRLHSLPWGDYYVAARFRSSTDANFVGGPLGSPMFFPGTVDATQAQRISLAPGEERLDIVFSLVATRTTRISGVVLDAGGAAAGGARVELLDPVDLKVVGHSYGNFGETFAGGEFTIIDVAPGAYVLAAKLTRPGGVQTTSLPVSVTGGELAGITLSTAPGVTVDGTVSAVPGAALPPLRATISAQPLRGAGAQSETLDRTTTFTLSGVAGPYAFTVDELPAGWALQSFEVNGTDIADGAYDFPSSGRMSARIVLTNRLTEVTGRVLSGQSPIGDADVVIFVDEPRKWTYPTRLVRAVRTDASGRFRTVGLPPAERYLAIALDYLDDDEQQDEELLQRLRARATAFTLREGGKAAVDLTMVSR